MTSPVDPEVQDLAEQAAFHMKTLLMLMDKLSRASPPPDMGKYSAVLGKYSAVLGKYTLTVMEKDSPAWHYAGRAYAKWRAHARPDAVPWAELASWKQSRWACGLGAAEELGQYWLITKQAEGKA